MTNRIFQLLVVLLLAVIALRPVIHQPSVHAQAARFDHVAIFAANFIYKGERGLLLLDKRNGNIWFMAHGEENFKGYVKDPVFLIRVPFEKLDQEPPPQ